MGWTDCAPPNSQGLLVLANDESLLERFVTKPLKQFFSRILLLCVAGLAHESHAADDPMIIEAIRERIAQGMPAEGLLFFNRDERETAFAHMDALFPTRAISASPSPKRLVSCLLYTSDAADE